MTSTSCRLFEEDLITEETALGYCSRRSAVGRGLDRIKAGRGESTTGITGLAMDQKKEEDPYGRRR